MLLLAIANLSLAVVCFWVAYKFWRWRRWFARLQQTLNHWEQAVQTQFPDAAKTLDASQYQIQTWQQQYALWQLRRRQLAQLLALIKLLRRSARFIKR
ncbi:MAG: hypothetical protein AAF921_05235 [Cyanobacteria bacterium P01_D01_bin.44]